MEILRHWQSTAVAHWKHIDPQLLGNNGAVRVAMQCVLEVLHTVPAKKAEYSLLGASSSRPNVPDAHAIAEKPDTLPAQEQNAFHSLNASLQECAEQLARLPIAWSDLRQLLHLLGAQIRHELQHGNTQFSPENTRLFLTFYDGVLEALAGRVADLRIGQLEQELAMHQEQTLATQHLAERFLGNASHELRTPLTAILGFAELLLEETYGALTPEQATTVGHIENSAQNLNEIVSNMLDLLHIRAGKLHLQYRPVAIKALLEHLFVILLPLAGRKSVVFKMELPDDLGMVEVDENIVRHIVYHLLSSALRATPAGGEVVLRVRRAAPSLILEASDTALHLPAEAVANMLDPFPRLENSPTRGYEGWEVGLSLVRRYVELHRGDLRLESLPDKGTIFTVTLPLTRPRNEMK
jgi:signal transduction histidine kinase